MLEAVNNTSILILVAGLGISIFIFLFSIYFFNRNRLKKFVIFDIAFIIIIIGLVSGRLIGMINSWNEYKGLGISLFPLEEIAGRIGIVDALPWEFFKINDGNFFLWGIPVGMILAIVVIYLISNRSKEYLNFADGIIMAFIPAKLIIIITQLISLTYYGKDMGALNIYIGTVDENRANLAVIELIIFLFVILILLIVKTRVTKDGLVYFIYVIYEIVVGYFLVSNVFYSKELAYGLETSQLISILIILSLILWATKRYSMSILSKRKRREIRSERTVSSEQLIETSELTDIEMGASKGIIDRIRSIFNG